MGIIRYLFELREVKSDTWPFIITCCAVVGSTRISWYGQETFTHGKSIEHWLDDNGIEYDAEQDGKALIWYLKDREAATLFILRWDNP